MVYLHANRPSDVAFLSLNLAMLGALGTHGARKCSTVSVESHHSAAVEQVPLPNRIERTNKR